MTTTITTSEDFLEQVLALARAAHDGQTRRHGSAYIEHPIAVAELADDLATAVGIELCLEGRAMALLHDVVEDSTTTRDEIAQRFGQKVARGVDLLTKVGRGPEAAAAYYARLDGEADDLVRLIKVSDRVHNLSELHLAPNADKLRRSMDETLAHVVPLAAGASAPVAQGLVAALHDALRAAARAQGQVSPAASRDALAGSSSRPRRELPLGVYAIVSGGDPAHVRELLHGGVAMIQLRAKHRTDRDVIALADALRPMCRDAGVPLLVNDRTDLAAAACADGVHLGQTDLPPRVARALLGASAYVGASSHTEAELRAAHDDGAADHVAVGPVFLSPTKQGHAPLVGLEELTRRCASSELPVVAIGGITHPARVAQCARAGASLVAAVSALEGTRARVMARRMSVSFFAARAAHAAAQSLSSSPEVVSAP